MAQSYCGIESLQSCLDGLHAARDETLTTALNISLVQGLAATGQFAEGMTLIDETIRVVAANGDIIYMPELLRLKGGLLLSMQQPKIDDAEKCLIRSLECCQGARAWELRTAMDLTKLLAAQGRRESARARLQPVFEQLRRDGGE